MTKMPLLVVGSPKPMKSKPNSTMEMPEELLDEAKEAVVESDMATKEVLRPFIKLAELAKEVCSNWPVPDPCGWEELEMSILHLRDELKALGFKV